MGENEKKIEDVVNFVYLGMLNFLSFKPRSEKEINDKLRKYISRSHLSLREKDIVKDSVISKLRESGYLKDSIDSDFSQSYISGLINSGKTSNRKKIYQFLAKKGVDREVIEKVLEGTPDDSFLQSALRDGEKKIRIMGDVDRYKKKRKLADFLYRKGYSSDVVTSVIDTLL